MTATHPNNQPLAVPNFVLQACRLLALEEPAPTLTQLAHRVQISPAHLHRVFCQHVGMSPKAYADACRAKSLRSGLIEADSVTDAMYAAGYGSSSRFYAHSEKALGMSVKQYRQGGHKEVLYFALGSCSLGEVLIASSEKGLVALLLGEDAQTLLELAQARFPHAHWQGGHPSYDQLASQVLSFLDQPDQIPAFPLDLRGTVFQCQVWQALQRIPVGTVLTYSELAQRIGRPAAVRAVASACAANHLAVIVPCHRVVRQDGGLGGYAWGLARKQYLLDVENSLT